MPAARFQFGRTQMATCERSSEIIMAHVVSRGLSGASLCKQWPNPRVDGLTVIVVVVGDGQLTSVSSLAASSPASRPELVG